MIDRWLIRQSMLVLLLAVALLARTSDAAKPRPKPKAVPQSDDLYILLDEISVFSCRGVKNELEISENDVNIVNDKGNKVYYIKAPGNYSLHFKRIQVGDNFGHLTGEIGVTLQVPILEGPAGIRFDVPYTMIPETGLLNQQCDEFSGIVERDKRQYCRYCELCGLSAQIENGLNKGANKFLPGLAYGKEEAFAPKCGKITANSYEFKRSISLPGRKELESKVKQKINGVDEEIRKRLNKGRGRFQVFLNLISAEQPPISQKAWFEGSEQCRCCGADKDPSCRNFLSFLSCNAEDCKSAWAQQCLHNSAKIVACYTVEFNYRMTTNHDDVIQFLRENKYPNQEVATKPPPT
ncbi:Protein C13C12.2 [Aphelenchoides avenae]|nr:Protein C13C12.2 [Aphelenchus avenae]